MVCSFCGLLSLHYSQFAYAMRRCFDHCIEFFTNQWRAAERRSVWALLD